jgi:S-adenosylmethionine decarboxylase
VWHTFPAPGGVTGVVVLAESHLACHTFPEHGSICLNLFCCRPREEFDAAAMLADLLGASETGIRRVERTYAPVGVVTA